MKTTTALLFCLRSIFLLTGLLFSLSSSAQYPNVIISNHNDPEEVSICINPKNPNQVVAGANIDNVFYSSDGGATWTSDIISEAVTGVWGDPVLFVDTTGDFYFSHLSNPPAGTWVDRIVFQKSVNGGVSWASGTFTGKNGSKVQDKEGIVVNPITNTIYVTWTQFDVYGSYSGADSSSILFSKSTDAGATWSAPLRINADAGNCVDSDSTMEGAIPMVGPSGELYVIWTGPNGLVFTKSMDDGATWLPHELPVTSMPGGWDYNISGLQRCNGLPQAICDLGHSAHRGNIYINWTDQRNGSGDTDVWLIRSTDGGSSWSLPTRVNDDAPGKQQFLSWMTVDTVTGNIYCVYYDRRNYAAGNDSTDVYLAKSVDGGLTFQNVQINQYGFQPSPTVFFGDYIGISAYNNIVRPIWMAYDGSVLSVWTALIDGATVGIEENQNYSRSAVEMIQNRPNPFNQSTTIHFRLKTAGKVDLVVHDMYGKEVAVLYQQELFRSGEYDYVFNANTAGLAPGVYTYTLRCKSQTLTQKMIVY